MWKDLLEIYRKSCLNEGKPECLFAETLIFNEGWLLRSVLSEWKTRSRSSRLPFLPFPSDAKVYSEGQLRTPFKSRRRGDTQAEAHTHVDGIAGHFRIAYGTKSGMELYSDSRYIAVFEAKLHSPIGQGVKNATDYDQISRTTACLIHNLMQANLAADCAAYIIALYPEDNLAINRDNYKVVDVQSRIRHRLEAYKSAGEPTAEIKQFETGWEEMFKQVTIHFETWEKVLDEIGDSELYRFYELCKQFNGLARP